MEFTLTDINKKAIDIFEIAGYKIKLRDQVFNDGSVTFGVLVDDVLKYGCSSTKMLTPAFAIRTIKDDARKEGYKKGIASIQKKLKDLIGI